jgi:hypothetical protein
MVVVGPVGKGENTYSAAWHEDARDLEILRFHEPNEILHDDVDAVLMEIAVVAEGEEIEFEALALDHPLAWDITDVDMSEIRLSGKGAEGREFRTVKGDQILVFGMLVLKGLENRRVVLVAVLCVAVAKESESF